jgi:hypothetical protein
MRVLRIWAMAYKIRSVNLVIRIRPEDDRALKRLARIDGLKLGTWCREALLTIVRGRAIGRTTKRSVPHRHRFMPAGRDRLARCACGLERVQP